jgi:hypothetical protein
MHKTAVTSGKRENCRQDPQVDARIESLKAGSQVFHQALENECQGIVEELPPTQTKEETMMAYMPAL